MTDLQKLMRGLDVQQPQWALQFASQQDLRQHFYAVERRGVEAAMESLREGVALGLMVAVRAAVAEGIVVLPDAR